MGSVSLVATFWSNGVLALGGEDRSQGGGGEVMVGGQDGT
jgi:hypothetical protein